MSTIAILVLLGVLALASWVALQGRKRHQEPDEATRVLESPIRREHALQSLRPAHRTVTLGRRDLRSNAAVGGERPVISRRVHPRPAGR